MKRTVLALAASAAALLAACAHDSGSYAPSGGTSSSTNSSSTTSASNGATSSNSAASPGTSPSSSAAAAPAAGASAQAAAAPSQSGSSSDMRQTIDCPASALAQAEKSLPPSSGVGTPGGTGSGSGAEAVQGQGQMQRVEGQITQIDSSRTARGIEVNGVKLWVEPSTPVLLDCQQSSVAELKEGTPVKATYEQKNGRNIAKVVEARNR